MTIDQHSAPAPSFFTSATTGPPATIDVAGYKRDGFALIENFLNRRGTGCAQDRNDPDLPRGARASG